MVNSISSINGTTSTTAVNAVTKTDETAKKEEEAKKTNEQQKVDEVSIEKTDANAYSKDTLLTKITDYIERLKKENDYPGVASQLDSYLALLDIDKFMETYPDISTDLDFNTIMYNETVQYL